MDAMRDTARELVAPGKGILAADESSGTIKKRFDQIGVESTEENRRYRQLLFTTAGLGDHISGVILFDETIRQAADDGAPFPEVLEKAGVIPGSRSTPCAPARALRGRDGDGGPRRTARPAGRVRRVRRAGSPSGAPRTSWARPRPRTSPSSRTGTRWRGTPLRQEAGIVPIVEPETLMDGDHDLAACEAATGKALDGLYGQLHDHRVDLAGIACSRWRWCRARARRRRTTTPRSRRPPCARSGTTSRGGPGHRLPIGRDDRRGGHQPAERDQRAGGGSVGDLVLLRSRAAAGAAQGVVGRRGPRRGRPGRARAPGPHERAGAERRVVRVAGSPGRLTSATPR